MTYASRLTQCLVGLTTALLISLPSTVVAADDDQDNWYQVEVIIFAREGSDNGIEQWPRNIALRYPLNWVALQDTEAQSTEVEEDLPSWERGLAARRQTEAPSHAHGAFSPLPSAERNMNRYAGAMERSGEYRVLFHEAWRQPVKPLESAPALLIEGGNTFGNHTELEGSITLSLSRYLHLHTRLWLTDFEPNYGQPPGAWPELPRRPDQRLSMNPSREPRDSADDWTVPSTSWEDDWRSGENTAWDRSLNTTSSLPDFMEEDYLPRRIATLTQQRRMRSDELHYIDHPLFGLLIKVTSYEPSID